MTRVTDNTRQVESFLTQKSSMFLRMMSEDIVRNSTAKTPKKTGRLRLDVIKQVLGLKGKIEWGKTYAVFQETKQFKNYTTPGTGPHYAENGVKDGIKNTQSVARQVGLI